MNKGTRVYNKSTELLWWAAVALLSTFIIGALTGFKFGAVDIQLHDTYYVFGSTHAIILLTSIFGFGRYFYLLIDIMVGRYVILALIISIINAIAGLFVFIATYFSIETIVASRKIYPDTDFSGHFLLPAILIGMLAVQAIVEVKMIRKLRAVLASK